MVRSRKLRLLGALLLVGSCLAGFLVLRDRPGAGSTAGTGAPADKAPADKAPADNASADNAPQPDDVPQPGDVAPQPVGRRGGWKLVFGDEFDGASVDPTRWADHSTAEADGGHGNRDNHQLEWNQAANCAVAGGELTMTARREPFTAPSGRHYDWTSCLLTSTPSFSFQYGFIEERAVLPGARGFWPAFWTWQVPGVGRDVETDVYEFYSDNHARLDLTQHSGAGGRCRPAPGFDPSAGWHTYGAAIEPSGTTWYLDGRQVCHTAATSDGVTNLISNLAVYATVPPDDATTTATKRVDYIRAWQRR